MKKSTLIMILSLVLAVALGVGGTLAYLQDTDEDVNVMTLGNVYIDQHEFERVPTENGYSIIETERGDSYELQEYTQGKPLYPAVINGNGPQWDTTKVYNAQFGDGHYYGAMDVFGNVSNAQDKFVYVENTGKSDAYVRTIIAYEVGALSETEFDELIGISLNSFWKNNPVGIVNIDDNNYYVVEYLYDGNQYPENGQMVEAANGRHPDGIVHPGEWTYNSLAQIYMMPEATNETMEAIDGNKNGTYDILVVSQAVQTAGFADAKTALDTAFGVISEDSHPWMSEEDGGQPPYAEEPAFPVMVSTIDELSEALQNGAEDILYTGSSDIIIGDGIEFTNKANISFASAGKLVFEDGAKFVVEAGADVTITGAEIESNSDDEIFVVAGGAVLTLGKGTTIANCNNAMSSGLIRVYGDEDGTGKLVLDGAVIENNNNNGVGSLFNVSSDTEVVIEEGTVISGNIFTGKSSGDPNGLFDIYDGKVIMNGGEISGNSFENRTLINLEQNGEFIMNGGEIKNNTYAGADSGRSVIRLTRTTSFEMNGGTITGNVIPGSSASIININKANVNINDGDITGNTMTYAVYNFDGTVNVDGDATVEGDVYTW